MKFSSKVLLVAAFLTAPSLCFAASTQQTITVTVTHAATPVITCSAMSVPDTVAKGTVAGTCTITMDDGTPFTGGVFVISAQTPVGIFAVQPGTVANSWNVIVDLNGPGVNLGPATDTLTVRATK